MSARNWLRDFREEEFDWEGTVWIPFWCARMDVSIRKEFTERDQPSDPPPTDRQLAVLDAVRDYEVDFLPVIETALYKYYEERVFESFVVYHDDEDVTALYAPELHSAAEIWRQIRSVRLVIPPLTNCRDALVFGLGGNCTWDVEHGWGVLVRDWAIAPEDAGHEEVSFRPPVNRP